MVREKDNSSQFSTGALSCFLDFVRVLFRASQTIITIIILVLLKRIIVTN